MYCLVKISTIQIITIFENKYLTMTSSIVVTATFTAIPYTIDVSVIGSNGGVSLDPNQASYIYGDVVLVTANPDPGYELTIWGGDLSGSDPAASVTMDGNKTVTAAFNAAAYTVTLGTTGNGQVSLVPLQTSYAYGDVITLTAAATAQPQMTDNSPKSSGGM